MIGEIEKLLDRDKLLNKEIIGVITSDTQIKAFNQMMNDLYMRSVPKYTIKVSGELEVLYSKQFNDLVTTIAEQIELRQQQIIFNYK
jgi:ribosome biogenesis protein Nip4